jgi:deoxyribodipyrimidine photolyase-related protein
VTFHPKARPRHLVIVLGDQLDSDSAGFDGFDAEQDAVRMAEVAEESMHVWSHKARIAVFLSAMRHFRNALRQRGVFVHYCQIDKAGNHGSFLGGLSATVSGLCPQKLIVVEPGEWRVRETLQ